MTPSVQILYILAVFNHQPSRTPLSSQVAIPIEVKNENNSKLLFVGSFLFASHFLGTDFLCFHCVENVT